MIVTGPEIVGRRRSFYRRLPLLVTVIGLLWSLVLAPFWSALLIEELGFLCTAQNKWATRPEVCAQGIEYVLPGFALTFVGLIAGIWTVWVAIQERHEFSNRGAARLLVASVVDLLPLVLVLLLATSSRVNVSLGFGIVLGLMLLVVVVAVIGVVVRQGRFLPISAGICAVFHVAALFIAPTIATVSILALSALLAATIHHWMDSSRPQRVAALSPRAGAG